MDDQRPTISVVTPVHNTEEYLEQCIASVLAQTRTDFEYLIIENCSDDGSGEIADRFAAEDSRIRVIRTPELLPQVENYNFALSHISNHSRYTKICQADDWLYPRCLEEMVALGDTYRSVGLIGAYSISGSRLTNVGLPAETSVVPGREAAALHLRDRIFLFGSATTVMYRSDLVRARVPFYAVGRLHEDTEACLELLESSDFGFVHQVLSYCREQNESITAAAADLLPEAIDRVIAVKEHGPRHLDTEDQRAAEAWAIDEYYRSLARRVLRGLIVPANDRFWDYQRRGLGLVGERIERRRLARAIVAAVAVAALSPLDLLQKLPALGRRRLGH